MSHSQFHSTKLFILRHAWLNLWDKHMTTGRINQVAIIQNKLNQMVLLRKSVRHFRTSHNGSLFRWIALKQWAFCKKTNTSKFINPLHLYQPLTLKSKINWIKFPGIKEQVINHNKFQLRNPYILNWTRINEKHQISWFKSARLKWTARGNTYQPKGLKADSPDAFHNSVRWNYAQNNWVQTHTY